MVMQARNPAQVNRLLGGSPPGAPPPNAFDMDPAELDRMLAEGWTMHEDGTMAPPAQPGGMNLGPQTGFEQGPALGGLPLGGGMAAGMGGAQTGPGVLAPSLPPSVAPQPPALPPNTLPQGVLSSGPTVTPPGLPPLELTPPPPDLGGVASTDPLSPPVSTGVGPDLGPSKGLGLDRGNPADFFAEEDAATAPSLDPFAYVREQNKVSATPSGQADPGGYTGPDVTRSDPTKLLPRRRRTSPPNGSPARLDVKKGIGRQRITHPARRP